MSVVILSIVPEQTRVPQALTVGLLTSLLCFQCEQDEQVMCGGIMDKNLVADNVSPWSFNGTISDFPCVSRMFM